MWGEWTYIYKTPNQPHELGKESSLNVKSCQKES
jgi:hypothetical protein